MSKNKRMSTLHTHLRRLMFLRQVVLALALTLLPAGSALAQGQSPAGPNQAGRESFIVVLKDGAVGRAAPVAAEHAARFGADVTFVYEHALKGYAARIAPGLVGALAADARVAYIERDGMAHTMVTQTGATWGLDRIDQQNLPLSTTYTYSNTGAGVTAYIIDTGIRYDHADFGGRASFGYDSFGGNGGDCNGHGTHVAGTVGGAIYGVAKEVTLVAVRVLNCSGSGSWSGVIAGIDWVTANAAKPAVANMSLGGGASTAVDNAVKNSIASGVSYAIAAGNGNMAGVAQDACKSSPARVPEAMTIGATDKTDRKASWSNFGSCIDWFAPGVGITSAWHTSNSATNTISGTSMATPHTAGVAALHLQGNPNHSPQQVRDALYEGTTKGKVTSSKTANNHLLFTNY
jgi:subtilisin family serine protease